jgi:hypothetical protein
VQTYPEFANHLEEALKTYQVGKTES